VTVTANSVPARGASVPEADAAVTQLAGVPLVVLTADCAPVAIAADDAVGVVHVGWQGLRAGVVAAAVDALRAIGAGPVRAAIGPCIRPADYEFGRPDLDALVDRFGSTVESRTRTGALALDLAAGVRAAFAQCDVVDVDDPGAGTADDADFFSYRRDGATGRQAVIVLREEPGRPGGSG
jgi:copper oxidase (laccase) domain-containing protein